MIILYVLLGYFGGLLTVYLVVQSAEDQAWRLSASHIHLFRERYVYRNLLVLGFFAGAFVAALIWAWCYA